MPNPQNLTHAIKVEASRLGFDLCRISIVEDAPHADFFDQWIGLERAGEMHYLARNTEKRRNPKLLADNGEYRSMIVLAVNHFQFPLPPDIISDPSRGIIASYAWGDDYHEIIRPALYELDGFIKAASGRISSGKCLVDTGPVLERDWAHRIGLGFTGKNCCTIHPKLGSWLILATILVPEELEPDLPLTSLTVDSAISPDAVADGLPPSSEYGRWEIELKSSSSSDDSTSSDSTSSDSTSGVSTSRQMVTCGRCTRCMDDCPTNAFVGPYHLDPQRCISYWTIEARSPIPRELRALFGNRIFGCDICQEVCPWNQRLEERTLATGVTTGMMAGLVAQAERVAPSLLEGFAAETPYWLNQEAFSARFRRSPIKRAKRVGMLRNVCVALGNWGSPTAIEAIKLALRDPEPMPRGHAAWALGQLLTHEQNHPAVVDSIPEILEKALALEEDGWVREEIQMAQCTM